MLTYISSGLRNYNESPVPKGQRGVWEFQAVIRGAISPVFQYDGNLSYQSNTIWIFPPDCIHGWTGLKGEDAEILVFHFTHVAEELDHLCRGRDSLSVKINSEEILQLKALHGRLHREYSGMSELYSLKSRMAADELALMICSKNTEMIKRDRTAHGVYIVEKCEALFRAEMHLGLNLIDISERSSVSAAHLRRLFHQVRGNSPRKVLEEIRMNRARELCCNTDYSFLEVAQGCGFSEQSAFSKAFTRYWSITPSAARENKFDLSD